MFALKLAEVMLCENKPEGEFDSCGSCPACQQVRANTHPDLILISKPADKAFIPVELFIGDKEHRRQEGLCHEIGLKPFRGGSKVAIVDDADFLNQEGANSLLKTLEEPPPNSLLILIGTSEQRQLPTIISRSQVIRFNRLTTNQVQTILEQQPEMETEVSLSSLAVASEGSVALAMELADGDTFEFRKQLFAQLATCDPGQKEFTKTVSAFVDAAGKEGAKKRRRLSLVADFAIAFFRHWYLDVSGVIDQPDSVSDQPDSEELSNLDVDLTGHVQSATARWKETNYLLGAEIAGNAIDRCVDLQGQIAANVNQGTAVEAWLIDLGKICRGKALTQA